MRVIFSVPVLKGQLGTSAAVTQSEQNITSKNGRGFHNTGEGMKINRTFILS